MDETQPAAPAATTSRRAKVPGTQPAAPAAVASASPDDGLPNAIDVDAKTIKGPVLTRQGWVCPDEQHQREVGLLPMLKV